ncbi:MAG: hypothetical protein HYV03_02090 [Deltaproteobacteria bacterium]|nr:hypothetical protein [Deltaproteobacteria bacterium]
MKTCRIIISIALSFLLLPPVWGAVSTDIPIGDVTYQYLDLLAAHRVLPAMISGQRPFTRMAVAQAIQDVKAADSPPLANVLAWLRTEYGVELDRLSEGRTAPPWLIPVMEVEPAVIGLDSPSRPIPPSNGLGLTGGSAEPLAAYWSDPTVQDGVQSVWRIRHAAQLGKWLAAEVQPQLIAHHNRDGSGQLMPILRTAYGKIGGNRLEILTGRGEILWGPGYEGGAFLSANAPPLDMVRVTTPVPFRLPGFLRHIGALKGGMFFAYLGNGYNPAHAILSGYRLDLQPRPWIAIGLSHAVFMGGEEMADPTTGDAVLEFLAISGMIRGPGHGRTASNHLLGLDMQVQIPQWRGLKLYGAYAYDDPDNNLNIQFNQDALWQFGFVAPRLSDDGQWSLRGEYLRAGVGTYRHGLYLSGWTSRGRSLGFPYGGNSNAGMMTVTHHFKPPVFAAIEGGIAQRSADQYAIIVNGDGDRMGIQRSVDVPDEVSGHLTIHAQLPLHRNIHLTTRGGYEHVWNTNFTANLHQNNVFAGLWLTLRFPARLAGVEPATP